MYWFGFLIFGRNLSNKYRRQLLDTATKTGADALKRASKKVVNKAAEATGEFIGKKIADKIMKTKPLPVENWRNVEEIVVPEKKRQETLNKYRQVL